MKNSYNYYNIAFSTMTWAQQGPWKKEFPGRSFSGIEVSGVVKVNVAKSPVHSCQWKHMMMFFSTWT